MDASPESSLSGALICIAERALRLFLERSFKKENVSSRNDPTSVSSVWLTVVLDEVLLMFEVFLFVSAVTVVLRGYGCGVVDGSNTSEESEVILEDCKVNELSESMLNEGWDCSLADDSEGVRGVDEAKVLSDDTEDLSMSGETGEADTYPLDSLGSCADGEMRFWCLTGLDKATDDDSDSASLLCSDITGFLYSRSRWSPASKSASEAESRLSS